LSEWPNGQRHYRELNRKLAEEGFTIDEVRTGGKSVRLRISRGGQSGTVACFRGSSYPDGSVKLAMKEARKIDRPTA
jgi:hypothetical protein